MQIAYNWLMDYLPQPLSVDEVSKILTSIGLEVEGVEKSESIPGGLEGLVIGEVLTCVPHPDADKLKITTVNVGDDTPLPIVCGAPNVAAGQKVVVATVGTTVHPTKGEAFKIKKAKIRGEVSEGMICAEDEIGLGESHDGIMILPADATVGIMAKDYFNIASSDFTIHVGLTPNRSDGNSHIGAARDICAYQTHHSDKQWTVKYPEFDTLAATATLPIDIEIKNPEACPRYAGVTIANVVIGPSPDWLVQRLQTIGVRSINNIVDITNYVLHEYGQPLHAFDYDKITDHKIIVQYAGEGEKFTTLDDKERTLRNEDLMIKDASRGLCIAGVFGGAGSGVSNETKNIFLESAYFAPKVIRRTSMHHGLRTDAATHFEKGVDVEMVVPALQRAAQLIVSIAGGNIASEFIDTYPVPLPAQQITVRYNYINNLCGKNYGKEDVNNILAALGFEIISLEDEHIVLKVPSNKPDVKQGADIAEEILRIDGLDNVAIPSRLNISLHRRPAPASRKWKEQISQYLSNIGLQEIVTNSITNSKYYSEETPMVRMINSLSSELDVMRPEMLESGLEVVSYNVNRKAQDLKLYEFGNIYRNGGENKYSQSSKLSIWVTGNKTTQHWQHAASPADIYYLKGIIAQIFELCGIKKIQENEAEEQLEWKRGKQVIAKAYAVDSGKLKSFDIKQKVFYAEIDVEALTDAANGVKVKYTELAKFPGMRRDLALVLDKSVPYSKVSQIAQSRKWEALKDFELFDVFESEKLGADKKSLALGFNFQLNDRTLTDEEVDSMMKELIAIYQKDLQAIIRE